MVEAEIGGPSAYATTLKRSILRLSTQPRLRADAAKNYDQIVSTARDLFASADGPISLDAIARAAGVGIGTLYRHFPTKEGLVDAVYHIELTALEEEAVTLLASQSSCDAMRRWLDRYATFVATKHGMHEALRIALTPRLGSLSETRARMSAMIEKFLAAATLDHSLRTDVRPEDLTLAFAGAVFAATTSTDAEQVGRVLDLLMAGLRPA